MRRGIAVLCFLLLVVPVAFVQAKKSEEPAQSPVPDDGVGSIVTILNPLVEFPWVVVSLDYMKETNGVVKHGVSSDESPMEYVDGHSRSVRVHLQLDGRAIKMDEALSGLVNYIDGANQRKEQAKLDMAWGRGRTWTGTLSAAAGSQGDVHGESFSQSPHADFNFTLVDAAPTAHPPRDFSFGVPGLDLRMYVLDFEFEKSIPWERSRPSHNDSPELEFSAPDAKSLSVELMFDTYEEGTSVRDGVDNLSKLSWGEPRTPPDAQVGMTWGNTSFRGMIVEVNAKDTMFLPDGTPVRADVTLRLEGVHGATWERPRDLREGNVVLWDHGFEVPSTLLALNLWVNGTNETGVEQVAWHKHANFDTDPFKFPQNPVNFSGQFFFDGFETKSNVSKWLEPLFQLTLPNQTEEKRPTRVVVTWGGSLPAFEGVIESIGVKYTMFSPDGMPVRATCNVTMKEAERLTPRGDAHGSDHNGTQARAEGSQETNANVTNITFRGPFTGDAAPLMDWALAVATGEGSAMTMKISFDAPVPKMGQWRCTALMFTPPQFTQAGVSQAKVVIRAEVFGLKPNEQPAFEPEMSRQRCIIDANNESAAGGGPRRERADEFVKATGFRIEISGVESKITELTGLTATMLLTPDPEGHHHSLGQAEWEDLELTGQVTANRSEMEEWYNRSSHRQGGEPHNATLVFTNLTGHDVLRFALVGLRPASYKFDGMGNDVDVEEMRLCVQKVERG